MTTFRVSDPNIRMRRTAPVVLITALLLQGCAARVPAPAADLSFPPALAPADVDEPIVRAIAPLSDSSLPALVAYALDHNATVAGAVARYQAAARRVPQATALPDPRLSYRYFVEEVQTRVGPQDYAVGISQALPWFGKLKLDGEAASDAARAAAARVGVAQNAVIASVARAWYELFYFGRALEIITGNRDLVMHLERVARTRYGTGAAGHPDIIRAQVELGKIENELASLQDRRGPLLARLNAALNRPSDAPLEVPASAPVQHLDISDAQILAHVSERNPELQAIAFDIAAARTRHERAKKDFFPDFQLGIDYIATDEAIAPGVPGSGDDPLAATVTVTLPIHRGRYRAGVEEANAGIDDALARRVAALNALESETVSALFRLRDAQRQIDLYRNTLLPKAHESLAATQRAYSAGTATFAELVDAQQVLLVFELAEARAITDHNLARTDLEALVGAPLGADTGPGGQSNE